MRVSWIPWSPPPGPCLAHLPGVLRLGLCCGFVEHEAVRFRTTTVKYASTLEPAKRRLFLHELATHNVAALRGAIAWCGSHGVGAFRVPSGLLPLATHPTVGWKLTDDRTGARIASSLEEAGREARAANVRLSFHPDQFVVLGSASEATVALAVSELEYQAACAALLGADQLTVHGGGAAGGKVEALERLRRNLDRLSPTARGLLVLENDDRTYTVRDLLPICRSEGIPLVYDVHHHRCNPDELTVADATDAAAATWRGREPWMHVSSPVAGWSGGDPRPHADYIAPTDVPREWLHRTATVDVEAKAKELAVLRLRRWLVARERGASTSEARR